MVDVVAIGDRTTECLVHEPMGETPGEAGIAAEHGPAPEPAAIADGYAVE
jgi:hypothetical protein